MKLKKNKWYHIAVVRKKRRTTMYINGKKVKGCENLSIQFWIKPKTKKKNRRLK